MPEPIRTNGLDPEKRGGPIDVCDHVSLPSAYPGREGAGEYGVDLAIRCEECDDVYFFSIRVN